LLKEDRKLKILASFSSFITSIHFFLIEAYSGSITALISTSSFFISINFKNRYLPPFYIIFYLIFGAIFYRNISDILSIVEGICGTISVFYFSGIRMRILSIITDIFWLSYNIIKNCTHLLFFNRWYDGWNFYDYCPYA
jgi:hypothetical protein